MLKASVAAQQRGLEATRVTRGARTAGIQLMAGMVNAMRAINEAGGCAALKRMVW